MNRSKFRQLERDIAEIRNYAIENPRASAINVVYFFREILIRQLRGENGFDSDRFRAAFRAVHDNDLLAQNELLNADLNSEIDNI